MSQTVGRRSALVVVCLSLMGSLAGTGLIAAQADPPDTPFSLATYPRVDGSTVTQPLGVAFKRLFTGQPVTSSDVVFSTTDPAYQNLIDGKTDLILVTYPSQDELNRAAAAGVEFDIIPVVNEAFIFLTNADNPVQSLTIDQIRDIYSGKITNWADVGGLDQPIIAYQRPANAGSQTGMIELVMGDTPMMTPPSQLIPYSMVNLVDAVTASFNGGTGALGYSYYYYVTQMYGDLANNPQLSKIKLMGVNGVLPTPDTIRGGEYPLHTAYYMVINKAEPAGSPTRQLVDAMLSHEGQTAAMQAGYVPVDATVPLPPPPDADPNALTSLTETYAVNPLTFTTSTVLAQSTLSTGCVSVTRLTVSGLADTALQADINARFRDKQDALGGLVYQDAAGNTVGADDPGAQLVPCNPGPGPTPVPIDPYPDLTATVGANFANVLSLQTSLITHSFMMGSGVAGTDALNVRLDTGADLKASDVFTTSANVGGMIQLEAPASNSACDEACANGKGMAYRSDPNPPFWFTSTQAVVMGVTIPYASYWQQIAIFKKYAGLSVAYTGTSPADCTVVSTVWDQAAAACVAVPIKPENWGTVTAPWTAGTTTVPLPTTANEEWSFVASGCSITTNLALLSPTSGTGVGAPAITLDQNSTSSIQAHPLCVIAVDQTTRVARYGVITVQQDRSPSGWVLTVDPADGTTLSNGTPVMSGTLKTTGGTPVVNQSVSVVADGAVVLYGGTWPVCNATTGQDGTWSCTLGTALANGPHTLTTKAADCSTPVCQWAETTVNVTVAAVAPAPPVILTPTMNQRVFGQEYAYISGTAVPGGSVNINPVGTYVPVDATGHWSYYFDSRLVGGTNTYTFTAETVAGGNRSAPASVTFGLDMTVAYAVAVTRDAVAADGQATDEVTVTMTSRNGSPIQYPFAFTVTATCPDAALDIKTPSVTADRGVATLEFSSETVGGYDVQLWVDGQPLPMVGYPVVAVTTPVHFGGALITDFTVAKDPYSALSNFPDVPLAADGWSYYRGTVTLTNGLGEPLTGMAPQLQWDVVETTHPELTISPISTARDNGDGTYDVYFASTTAGTFRITPGLPQTGFATGLAKTVTFISGPCSDNASCYTTVASYDKTKVGTGEPVTVQILAESYRQSSGIMLDYAPGRTVTFTPSDPGVVLSSDTCVTGADPADPAGVCSITATSDHAGTYTLGIVANGTAVQNSGVTITVAAPSPVPDVAQSSVVVSAHTVTMSYDGCGTGTQDPASLSVTVTVKDAAGVPIPNMPVQLAIGAPLKLASPAPAVMPSTDDQGKVTVPLSVDWASAPANGVTATVGATVAGVVLTPDSVVVQTNSATHVPNGETTIGTEPAPASVIPADGHSTWTVWVQLGSVCGVIPPNTRVDFVASGHATVSDDWLIAGTTGRVTVTVTDTTAETVTLTATAPGQTGGSVQLVFGPAPAPVPDATQSSVVLSAHTVTMTYDGCAGDKQTPASLSVTVTVKDAAGVPIPNAPVQLGVDAPLQLPVPAVQPVTDEKGMVTVPLTVDWASGPANGLQAAVRATVSGVVLTPDRVTLQTDTAIYLPNGETAIGTDPLPGSVVPADGSSTWTVKVQLGSVCGVIPPNTRVDFVVSGHATLSDDWLIAGTNGQVSVTVTDTTPETVTVTVSAPDQIGGGVQLVFSPVPQPVPDPGKSTVEVSSEAVVMRAGGCPGDSGQDPATLTATVTVRDAAGTPIPGAPVALSVESPLVLDPAYATVDADVNGKVTVPLTVDWSAIGLNSAPPAAAVKASVGDVALTPAHILASVMTIAMPAPPVPQVTVVPTVAAPVPADGTSSWTATVSLQWCGAPVTDEPVTVTVSGAALVGPVGTPGTGQSVTLTTDDQGVARAQITDATPETVNVTAATSDPLMSDAVPVEFVAVGPVTPVPDATQSTVAVSAPSVALASDGCPGSAGTQTPAALTATVTVKDAAGVPIPNTTVWLTVDAPLTLAPADASPTTDGNGQVTVPLGVNWAAVTLNASAAVHAQVGDVVFTPKTVTVTKVTAAVETTAPQIAVTPQSGVQANGSSAYTLTATVVDTCGVPVVGTTVTFAAAGGTATPAAVDTEGQGHATTLVTASSPGTVTVTATVGSLSTTQDLVFDPVPPVPDAAHSSVVVSAHTVTMSYDGCGTGTQDPTTVSVTVTVKDAAGVPIPNMPVQLAIGAPLKLASPAPAVMPSTDDQGKVTVPLSVDWASAPANGVTATVGATVGGVVLTPDSVVVQTNSATHVPNGETTIGTEPAPASVVPADGHSTWTVWVQLGSVCGVIPPNTRVDFVASGHATVSDDWLIAGTTGRVTVTVTDTTPETVTLTVSAPGQTGGSVQLVFGPVPAPVPDPGKSAVAVSSASVVMKSGGCPGDSGQTPATLTATVTVRDASGALMPGTAVQLGTTGPLRIDPAKVSATTDPHGQVTVPLTVDWASVSSTNPVAATVTATAAGVTLTPAPVSVSTMTLATPAPPQPQVTVAPTTATPVPADGTSSWTATVSLQWCSAPVTGRDVTVSVTGTARVGRAGTAGAASVTVPTDTQGTLSVVITDTTAETVTVTATTSTGSATAPVQFTPYTPPQRVPDPTTSTIELSAGLVTYTIGGCPSDKAVQIPATLSATITIRDATGAPIPGIAVTVGADGPLVPGTTPPVTNADGQVTVPLTIAWASDTGPAASVRATAAGVTLTPAQVLLSVILPVPAPPSPHLTVVPLSSTSARVDVSLVDVCGTPWSGMDVAFTVTGGAALNPTHQSTDPQGRTSVTVTAGTVTPVTLTATTHGGSASTVLTFTLPPTPKLAITVAQSGRDYTFTGTGFAAGELVSAEIHSSVVPLTPAPANANGVVVFTWTAPAGFTAGQHQIVMTGASGTVSAPFTVGQIAPTGGSTTPPGVPLVALAVLLVAAGAYGLYRTARGR